MPQTSAEFSIDLTPGEGLHAGTDRFDFTKTWTGGLTGTSVGTMLSAGDPGAGHAGYVALERFEGEVDGREGTLVFQQFGTMDAAGPVLTYLVTPGSGTGALAGLTGTLNLDVVDGVHRVEFDYTI